MLDIINAIAEADPTPRHKYKQWLVNQYLNEEFRLEDVDRVKHEIKQFLTIQKKLLQPDLGQCTYAQMSDTVNKAYGNVTLIGEVSDLQPDIKVLHSSELGSIMRTILIRLTAKLNGTRFADNT